jgi:2-polyprenyl-6-methoxyphenol hydroxylase-like FAD-dependent oxidoreductase
MPDVLVVGAGPVGLTMAAELARHGQRCRIVDRLAAPSGFCKAIGVTPRTLEVFDDMGIAMPMIDAGLWLRGLRVLIAGAPPRDVVSDLPELPYGELGIPQYETERILAAHLAAHGGTVERGVALAGLHDDGRRIAAELRHADGRSETAEFRYVVGCDGAHSAVRHTAGIGFPGDRFRMDFMLGDVIIDWNVPRGFGVFAVEPHDDRPPDFVVAIPLPDRNRYRVSMIAPQEDGEPEQDDGEQHGIMRDRPGPDLSELQRVTDAVLPGRPRLSSLRWSSLFRISMRLADKYRVGNVFIAGDAAHIHPPTGGQGMNTGIQDAYNLAWKMALVLRGVADDKLLDSYEAERRPVGADVVARTRAASLNFGRGQRTREDALADTQVLVNYRASPWVEDAADAGRGGLVRAGDRAPDADGLRRDQVAFPLRLFDLLRGPDHVLLACLAAPDGLEELEDVARWLAHDGLARVVAIAPAGVPAVASVGAALIRDAEGRFVRAYGAAPGMVFLIRPDGYVGYRADKLDRAGLASYLARTLGRNGSERRLGP